MKFENCTPKSPPLSKPERIAPSKAKEGIYKLVQKSSNNVFVEGNYVIVVNEGQRRTFLWATKDNYLHVQSLEDDLWALEPTKKTLVLDIKD